MSSPTEQSGFNTDILMKELILGGYIPILSGNSQTTEVDSKNLQKKIKNALSIGTISKSNTKKNW